MRIRIDEQLIVRAGHHAGAAADAGVAVQIDDAVAPAVECVGRTDPRARRVVALIAEDGEKESAGVGEGACSMVLTQQRLTPIGISCSALQAIVHA